MKRLGLAALLGAASLISGCSNAAEVHYRVTVEIEDNGERRSGSSVWSWKLSEPTVALASAYDGEFRGEAVAVDIGDGVLFALLRDEDNNPGTVQMWPERLFADLGSGSGDRVRSLRQIAGNVGAVRELPRFRPAISDSRPPTVQYPMLVRFRDLGQPESLERVDPAALDGAFGAGVRLTRITVEITDDPVTTGLRSRLPWLEQVGRSRATILPNPPRRPDEATPIQFVEPSAFSTELYQ
mgnify:CR=1 FL=1